MRTMNAAHRSFSAPGSSLILSRTCILVNVNRVLVRFTTVINTVKTFRVIGAYVHFGHGSEYRRTAQFYGNDRIETAYGSFKRYKCRVLVREDTKKVILDTKSYAGREGFLCRHKPVDSLSALIYKKVASK